MFKKKSPYSFRRKFTSRGDKSEPPVHVPPGYIELYDKETGLISYRDEDGQLWNTNLDPQGRLYFYARIEKEWKSEWKLPEIDKEKVSHYALKLLHIMSTTIIKSMVAFAIYLDLGRKIQRCICQFSNCYSPKR